MAESSYHLGCMKRFSYGVGHVLNDLCASMWFSYLLLYFHSVICFTNSLAGDIMLLGQIVDAICTPFIGYESDRTKGIGSYGKRKTWHLVGTLSVFTSFPFLFMPVLGTQKADDWARVIYYAPFVIIFQFGWAATQISHLSLIPELTQNESERVELNAIRYTFTVISNIAVYTITWLLLDLGTGDDAMLGPQDVPIFRNLAFIVCGAGILFCIIFHLGVKEQPQTARQGILQKAGDVNFAMTWKDWLKEVQFYQVSLLYMCTRLIVNITQIYLPMFLTSSLDLHKMYIATIPLTVFVSGFIVSFIMKSLNKLVGRKATYLLGTLMIGGACVWLWFVRAGVEWEIYLAAVLLGAGGSTILVTSLSMTADLIGDRTESGAFVYGAMSFTDKLSNGVVVLFLQNYHPCNSQTEVCCPACVWYYRDIMVILPGVVAGVAVLTLLSLLPRKIGDLKKYRCLGGVNQCNPPRLSDAEDSDDSGDCCNYALCFGTSKDMDANSVQPDVAHHVHQKRDPDDEPTFTISPVGLETCNGSASDRASLLASEETSGPVSNSLPVNVSSLDA